MTSRQFKLLNSLPVVLCVAWVIRLYVATLRLTVINEQAWLDHYRSGGRILLCGWHQQLYPMIAYLGKHRPSIMISRSKDGEFIARVAQRIGWLPVRGSSSKGGASALRQMLEALETRRIGGHVLDGPRGPSGKVKKGAIFMATSTGAALVPVRVRPEKAWFFRKSWDRFFVPKPFSKVTVTFGDPTTVAKTDDLEQLEAYRVQLETAMTPVI